MYESLYLYIYLCVHRLYVCTPVWIYVCKFMDVCLSVCLPACLAVCVCLSVSLPACLHPTSHPHVPATWHMTRAQPRGCHRDVRKAKNDPKPRPPSRASVPNVHPAPAPPAGPTHPSECAVWHAARYIHTSRYRDASAQKQPTRTKTLKPAETQRKPLEKKSKPMKAADICRPK